MTNSMILVVVSIILIVFVIAFVSFYIFTPTTTTSQTYYPPTRYNEHARNMQDYLIFPPCYDIDVNAKRIFAILSKYNYLQKYHDLLDILSTVLCMEKIQYARCIPLDIQDRYTQVLGMGGDANDKVAREKAASFIPVNETPISKFLVGALHIVDRNMIMLQSDSTISKSDREQVSGNIYSFFATHYPQIYQKCTNRM